MKKTLASRLSKSAIVAIALTLPLGTVTALADTHSVDSHFTAQYQQNANQEATLLAKAQASSATSTEIDSLKNRVQFLSQQISTLYNSEQALSQNLQQIITQSGTTSKNFGQLISSLVHKRNSIQKQIRDLNKQQERGDHGRGKGRGHGHGRGNDRGNVNASTGVTVSSLQNLMSQLKDIQNQITSTHKERETEFNPNPDKAALSNLESAILRLQAIEIHDTQLWISLESQAAANPGGPGSTPSPTTTPTTLTITPSETSAIQNSVVTYTVQLVDSSGHPVAQAGVKVDFSLVNGSSDGTLSSNYAMTNNQGQATVTVTTGQLPGSVDVSANIDGSSVPGVLAQAVEVGYAQPLKLMVVNPNWTSNVPFNIVTPGVNGPFTIEVVNSSNGAVTAANADIHLTASEVNQIIGTGTGIRLTPNGSDVTGVTIQKGQSSIQVYADNASVGATNPTTPLLSTLAPSLISATVTAQNAVELTFSEDIAATTVSNSDFTVSWNGGTTTPQSVAVSGNTVTLVLPSASLAAGQTVNVSYNNPSSNGLVSVWGAPVASFSQGAANTL